MCLRFVHILCVCRIEQDTKCTSGTYNIMRDKTIHSFTRRAHVYWRERKKGEFERFFFLHTRILPEHLDTIWIKKLHRYLAHKTNSYLNTEAHNILMDWLWNVCLYVFRIILYAYMYHLNEDFAHLFDLYTRYGRLNECSSGFAIYHTATMPI